jgi:heme/copper-type cytochrome/quinol oxidase subunit 2
MLGDGSREGLSPTDHAGDTVLPPAPPLPVLSSPAAHISVGHWWVLVLFVVLGVILVVLVVVVVVMAAAWQASKGWHLAAEDTAAQTPQQVRLGFIFTVSCRCLSGQALASMC